MPSAKKLRGKKKKKAKEQRRDALAVDNDPARTPSSEVEASRASVGRPPDLHSPIGNSVLQAGIARAKNAKEKVESIVKFDASLIKVPLELGDDQLSELVHFGLLGALLYRVYHGFEEMCNESFTRSEADIQQSLTTWFDLLSTISRRAPAQKTKLIPQYLERVIPRLFYCVYGSEEHDPKSWIAIVLCGVADRLMTCTTFYKYERLHQSALSGVLCVLATLEEGVDELGAVTTLYTGESGGRYPFYAIELLNEREDFLKFTCKEMIRCHYQSVLEDGAAPCDHS